MPLVQAQSLDLLTSNPVFHHYATAVPLHRTLEYCNCFYLSPQKETTLQTTIPTTTHRCFIPGDCACPGTGSTVVVVAVAEDAALRVEDDVSELPYQRRVMHDEEHLGQQEKRHHTLDMRTLFFRRLRQTDKQTHGFSTVQLCSILLRS